MMIIATELRTADAKATRSVRLLVSSGRGNRTNNIKPQIRPMIPTGSRKDLRLGIRLERRWLSIIFTAPITAALRTAVLTQFT